MMKVFVGGLLAVVATLTALPAMALDVTAVQVAKVCPPGPEKAHVTVAINSTIDGRAYGRTSRFVSFDVSCAAGTFNTASGLDHLEMQVSHDAVGDFTSASIVSIIPTK